MNLDRWWICSNLSIYKTNIMAQRCWNITQKWKIIISYLNTVPWSVLFWEINTWNTWRLHTKEKSLSNTQVRKNVSSFKNFSKEKEGASLIRNLTIERVDIFVSVIQLKTIPSNIYLFKVNKSYFRKRCELCSKLIIKTPKRRQWRCSGVFIVNFEHISHFFLLFLFIVGFEQKMLPRAACFSY